MLVLHDISFAHPGRDDLFSGIHLSAERRSKVALIGDNGSGKSTLLRIIAGTLPPRSGMVMLQAPPYHAPQLIGTANGRTVAQALGISTKLDALQRILAGDMRDSDLITLGDDWQLEERCRTALDHWMLQHIGLTDPLERLSGGERTKVMLAGIAVHAPELLLLDEPSNHLDATGRALLYQLIEHFTGALIVVSHDRALLDRCTIVHLLERNGTKVYGGNFSFYEQQRAIEQQALNDTVHTQEKELRKARRTARESAERQQKLDARGKRKQEKAGVPKIMLNTLRDQAQQSTARLQGVHADRISNAAEALRNGREALGPEAWMRFGFGASAVHQGKMLAQAEGINILRDGRRLWPQGIDLHIRSGERIAVSGANGSGKTTLLQLITGTRGPSTGTIHRAFGRAVYVDQHYSLIDNTATVLQHAQRAAAPNTPEHVVKTRLDHFLFTPAHWDKPGHGLSGGERLRLTLCGLTLAEAAPDLLVLDEPTNNLDLRNMGMLVKAVAAYTGTLLVVSHDARFLHEVGVERHIQL